MKVKDHFQFINNHDVEIQKYKYNYIIKSKKQLIIA